MTKHSLALWILAGAVTAYVLIAISAAHVFSADDWLATLGAGAIAQDSGEYFATNDWRG